MSLEGFLTINIQPIFNTNTMQINYAEVLLRSLDGETSVGHILETMHLNGRSVELDKFILNKTCQFIRQYKRKSEVKITVNISKYTLEKPKVYNELLEIINKISKRTIILELSELTDYSNSIVRDNIQGLIENGVQLAMDDFGVGNSNIQSLLATKVKLVKFDKVFLDVKDNRELSYITQLVKNMHNLGIDTVIEGVETSVQLQSVKYIGYGHIQGFMLARPMSTEKYRLCVKR